MSRDLPADQRSVVSLLDSQRRSLSGQIEIVNQPGSLDGLFARHILSGEKSLDIAWDVSPIRSNWIDSNRDRVDHAPIIAAFGYGLTETMAPIETELLQRLDSGLRRLVKRDAFPEDRVSYANNVVEFLGVCLAARAVGADSDVVSILKSVIDDPRCRPSSKYHEVVYSYIRHVLDPAVVSVGDVGGYSSLDSLSALCWGVLTGWLSIEDRRMGLGRLEELLLQSFMQSDVTDLGASRAAIVLSAVQGVLGQSVATSVLSRTHVVEVLRRFEPAMKRWRWDPSSGRQVAVQWPINSEREVQDIVWLVLRSVFNDLVDEETLPKVGHSSYRADFGIPSLRLLVEVKFARVMADLKAIEKEIMEDSIGYLLESRDRYDGLLVFIYDDSSSVQEHDTTIQALRKVHDVVDVIVVSRPSQLTDTTTARRRGSKH